MKQSPKMSVNPRIPLFWLLQIAHGIRSISYANYITIETLYIPYNQEQCALIGFNVTGYTWKIFLALLQRKTTFPVCFTVKRDLL